MSRKTGIVVNQRHIRKPFFAYAHKYTGLVKGTLAQVYLPPYFHLYIIESYYSFLLA